MVTAVNCTRIVALICICACLGACTSMYDYRKAPATSPLTSEDGTVDPRRLGRIALVVKPAEFSKSLSGYLRDPSEGAAAGWAYTALGCFEVLAGVLSMYGLISGIVVCPVIGLVGAPVGAAVAPSAEQVSVSERSVHAAIDALSLQERFRRDVELAAERYGRSFVPVEPAVVTGINKTGNYAPLLKAGADLVMEVAVTSARILGRKLVLDARTWVIDPRNDETVFSAIASLESGDLAIWEWSANDGERVAQGLTSGSAILARHLYDRVFFRTYPYHSLEPIHPPDGETLANLRPVFSWQTFPGALDMRYDIGEIVRVTDVRYDFVLAKMGDGQLLQVVYRKDGLPAPSHRLDIDLQSASTYYWSARARFILDGVERVTEWSSSPKRTAPGWSRNPPTPSEQSIRFQTR